MKIWSLNILSADCFCPVFIAADSVEEAKAVRPLEPHETWSEKTNMIGEDDTVTFPRVVISEAIRLLTETP